MISEYRVGQPVPKEAKKVGQSCGYDIWAIELMRFLVDQKDKKKIITH